MLQDWNDQQRVVRMSQYGAFHVEEKLEFLSAIAYDLLASRAVSFDSEQLEASYRRVAPQFDLPDNQADRVVREIETHTGLIVQSGTGYEFSHLSLQEYLAAYYLVRQPFSYVTAGAIYEFPAQVAVAVSLSSDPSAYLIAVVEHAGPLWGSTSRYGGARDKLAERPIVNNFVARLADERPRFRDHPALGFALLKLLSRYEGSDDRPFRALLQNHAVIKSIRLALSEYEIASSAYGDVSLTHRGASSHGVITKVLEASGVLVRTIQDICGVDDAEGRR